MEITRFKAGQMDRAEFTRAIEDQGLAVAEGLLDDTFINKMKAELEQAIEKEAEFHGTKSHKDYGMLLACPIYGGTFLTLADNATLMRPFDWILGDTCIIYVYTSSSMPPDRGNYSSRIHVDRPHFIPGYTEAMGCLVLLDDFTAEAGATWVLPGSHVHPDAPDEAYFWAHAVQVIAPRGSVFYFHLRLWHAGGENKTDKWRHSVGFGMVRGNMKQRIDLPRALHDTDLSGISDLGLQKLGFFSLPPSSLEEFYAPPEKRPYRQRSEWNKGTGPQTP